MLQRLVTAIGQARQRCFSLALILLYTTFLIIAVVTSSQAGEPLGVPDRDDIEYPDDDPPSEAEVRLGKLLFFDRRLSGNNRLSCASCHNPDLGFGDGLALGLGAKGNRLTRHTPHLYNLAWNTTFL